MLWLSGSRLRSLVLLLGRTGMLDLVLVLLLLLGRSGMLALVLPRDCSDDSDLLLLQLVLHRASSQVRASRES